MSCAASNFQIGGVLVSTSDFVNMQELLTVSGDQGDPTADADDESIAGGNNVSGTTGIQIPPPTQTSPPGVITQKPGASNTKPAPGGNGTPVTCDTWDGDYDFELSTNFKLRDFTLTTLSKNPVTDLLGLTASQRVCNLQSLAVNIAEPLRARFGSSIKINSGLRNTNSTSSGVSQHVSGQAMDIQFPGWTYDRYWENAQWVKDNIPYDQFIFEHSSKTGLAWYHLSFDPLGNRLPTSPRKVMTMYRNRYSTGLHKFA
jgi:hypothetical protein